MLYRLNWGEMPSREQFDKAWEEAITLEECDRFTFGNDPRVGTCKLTQDQLWDELNEAYMEMNQEQGPRSEYEETGNWISCVLYSLGIEWI